MTSQSSTLVHFTKMSCKTLDFYLKLLLLLLLLLLENVKHNQSLMQHCPMRTEFGAFPNFTSEAGSPFFFKLPIPETPGHTQHHRLSLADGDSTLPHWMVFRQQTSSLVGLALTEDCGIYHLKVSVIGEKCASYFYLHILNRTGTDPARDTSSCSEGEMTIWANLLLQLNPVTLDADQRVRLVSTMADYLRLPLRSVYLFSRRNSFLRQEKLRVCGHGEKMTRGNEKRDSSGDVAELLWPVGCQGEERRSDLAAVLEHTVKAGWLAELLVAPVSGWRVLCAPGGVRRKVKRDLQRLKFTPTPKMIVRPPTVNVKLEHPHIYSPPLTKMEPSLLTILLDRNDVGTRLEPTHPDDSTENTVISVSKELLAHVSGTQVYTFPDSPEKAFRFTSETFETLMYRSNPEMTVDVLKTNHMQKIQISSNSPFSIKQTCTYPYSKDVNDLLELQVFTGKNCFTTLHTPIWVEFGCSHPNCWLSASKTKPLVDVTVSEMTSDTSQSISEYFRTTGLCPLPFLPEHLSTARTLPSSTLHSIYPSLLLTPASYSVTSTLTHEAVDRKSHATRLTLRPRQKETPLWTGSYRASRTDSDCRPTVGSMGHIICNQGSIEGHHTAKPTLLPCVSHPPLTESYNDVPPVDPTLKTIQLLPPSNKIPSAQPFPDVSPNSCLTAERLSTTQHSDTIQRLSSVLNQDVMSQLDVTTQGVSSTSITGQLTLSGQTELESSLSTSLFEPSVVTFTPALPSELCFFSETPKIINPVFTVESPKASSSTIPLLQTFSTFLLPDIGVSSLQDDLESPPVTDLQPKSGIELGFGQTILMQTLSSDVLLASLQPTWALHMSLPLTETLSVPEQFMLSVQQTLHTLLFGESQQIGTFYHISLVTGMTQSVDLNTAAGPVLVSEDHFDPTAPSTVQEPYTTSFSHQLQDLDPSFPLVCGQSVMQDHVYLNGCTPQINSTYIENTVEHFLDSYSQDEETSFPSQFFMLDSSGQFFSTQTSMNYLSTDPLPSEDVLREQAESKEFTSLLLVSTMHLFATTEINHLTATLQMDISDTLPALEDTGFSAITSALSGNCVSSENSLLICQTSATDSSGLITLQILSTSLSRSYGMSTALLTSLQVVGLSSYRRESSVQPTPSSASISSSMNLPPQVLQSIPVLMATVGFPFHYSIPPETFQDPEDGDADALSLEIRLIEGPPLSVGTWLALDGLELHGVPLELDLQFAPQRLLLAARDGQGLSARLPLTLDLRRNPVDPCHVFTLTAQRSLHSVLRHRHRVELLLGKLSRFFDSSSSHQLSIVSMRPGSTVVSWYNYSLCGTAHSRATPCRVDQIRSMWLAMRSADGSVNHAFREAMLPEFPITKVGPVSYRRDCFSTTSTPTFGGSTPAVHTTLTPGLGTNASLSPPSASPAITATSQQITHYRWMAGMFTALLVVCLLILIVLLVAAVLHFCKGRGRSRTVAIWPASRALSVRSRDLRAIRPRRPPLFQPELPPPPLRLWINLSQADDGRVSSRRERGRKTADEALQPRHPQYDFSSIKK